VQIICDEAGNGTKLIHCEIGNTANSNNPALLVENILVYEIKANLCKHMKMSCSNMQCQLKCTS
jgi:hypothetical protein